MLTDLNNSDTAIVVIHEIYGINGHMINTCQALSERLKVDVYCPDLLDRESSFHYDEEKLAYENFVHNVGFEKAFLRIKSLLGQIRGQYHRVLVLGFSVGATTAWLCTEEDGLCDGVIGYYGSRIRDYTDIAPKCPVLLFYPKEEQSFDVEELSSTLRMKNNVRVEVLGSKHGFSDPGSSHYCQESALKANHEMIEFIKTLQR
ncbi:dienelactone hydrolase family protein [Paenibacillus sp. GCM10012306]|uniref:dienelactone hydrolase family protein n=1 Tax=Paenibacillus sp. GCM10012306 TaxID=3317342 RepID=UPI003610E2B2